MQEQQNVIKTKVDPKDFRAKYARIKVRDAEIETTAETEIINEDVDLATGIFTMQIALHYSRRSTHPTINLAFPARKDGQLVGIRPPNFMLTQQDFEAVMRGEVITVSTNY